MLSNIAIVLAAIVAVIIIFGIPILAFTALLKYLLSPKRR